MIDVSRPTSTSVVVGSRLQQTGTGATGRGEIDGLCAARLRDCLG